MTTQLIELSQAVGRAYEILPFSLNPDCQKWLHEDIGRCASLAIEHGVWIMPFNYSGFVRVLGEEDGAPLLNESYEDHDNNKELATCVAVLKALLAIKQ